MLDASRIESRFEEVAVEAVSEVPEAPPVLVGSPQLFEFRADPLQIILLDESMCDFTLVRGQYLSSGRRTEVVFGYLFGFL